MTIEKAAVVKKVDGRRNNGGARAGAGRPAFVPTDDERRQVEGMSGFGVPLEQIGALVRGGISTEALTAHFRPELITGKAKANTKVGQTLFQKAIDGDVTAMIWWSKSQMRWSDAVQRVELTGAGGTPLTIATQQLRRLSDEEIDQMETLLLKLAPPAAT